MELSLGELIDKLTITHLKDHNGTADVKDELGSLNSAYCSAKVDHPNLTIDLEPLFQLLHKINAAIWPLEADVGKGKQGRLALEEVGKTALVIRNINAIRVHVKNMINQAAKSGFPEKKVNHASGEEEKDQTVSADLFAFTADKLSLSARRKSCTFCFNEKK